MIARTAGMYAIGGLRLQTLFLAVGIPRVNFRFFVVDFLVDFFVFDFFGGFGFGFFGFGGLHLIKGGPT